MHIQTNVLEVLVLVAVVTDVVVVGVVVPPEPTVFWVLLARIERNT